MSFTQNVLMDSLGYLTKESTDQTRLRALFANIYPQLSIFPFKKQSCSSSVQMECELV